MWRILRAFAWLRWRMLINSLEKTGARDTLERFSLAIEKLGPIMAAVLMVPSGLALSALGAAGGFALARGEQHSMLFAAARFILLAVPVFSIIGPLLLPAADRSNPVRLLLLPISRRTLYVAQSASAFGDIWVVLMLPVVVCVPLGLAAGGAPGAALFALICGAMLVAVVVGISSLATSLLHLAVRDRRRGELLALIFILVIPMVSMLPGMLQGERRQRRPADATSAARERLTAPPWVAAAGERAFALYPTELYATATRAAARGDLLPAAGQLAALAVTAALLHGVSMFAFARVLDSPGSTGARRAIPMHAAWGWTLPGLSPGASAVALAQLRLALRTPRGRSILLSPIIMFVFFGFLMRRAVSDMEFGPFSLQTGLGLASFASFICLMSILPIAMNQFAIDKAGVTLALLSPLTDREYLAGKAVGNALIAAPPALVCVLAARIAFPGGSPALWLAIPIALASVYLLVAPLAAIFSAMFPRAVDMNSIGRGSNAHGLSGLLGLLAFLAAGVPCLLIVMAASRWIQRPALVPVLLLGWCAFAFGANLLLFTLARTIFARRRENLSMLAAD
jgi:hypothetical protein